MAPQSKDPPPPPAGQDRNQNQNRNQNELSKPKRITNPRRLLIVSPTSHAQSTIPQLLHSLTGVPVTAPPQAETSTAAAADTKAQQQPSTTTSFAGYTTHAPLRIQTKYYTADVPIWVDEIPLTLPHSSSSSDSNDNNDGREGASSAEQQDSTAPSTASSSTTTPTTAQWKTEFLSDEARVVRDAIGAIVICAQNPDAPSSSIPREGYTATTAATAATPASSRADVRALKDLVRMIVDVKSQTEEERGEEMGEVPGLLVLVDEKKRSRKQGRQQQQQQEGADDDDGVERLKRDEEVFSAGWWEDELYDMGVFGFEVVVWDPKADKKEEEEKRNQFGEYEGMRRIREVLETHDWSAATTTSTKDHDDHDDILHSEEEDGEHDDGFKLEVDELEREMMGLKFAVQNGGDDDDHDGKDAEMKVEELETLMMRMRAIKDMSADLPESQRKAFAQKAIRDIMREL